MENKIIAGDAIEVLKELDSESIDLCFTSPSPPFYAKVGIGIGSEDTEEDYIYNLLELFCQVHRVLKKTGSLFLQMGDYHIDGELPMIPERLAILMKQDWVLRSKLVWHRTERFEYQEDYARFARDWEYLFFFTKSKDHYFNNLPDKICSSVLSTPYQTPRKNEFESGFPEKLIELAIYSSCPKNGTVLDPLCGTGTTGKVAKRLGRNFILIDQNYDLVQATKARLGIK